MKTQAGWGPSRAVFLRRVGVVAAVTFAASLAALLLFSAQLRTTPLLAAGLAVIAALAGVYEDFQRWRRVRFERWEVEGGHLIHTLDDDRAVMPLADLRDAQPRLGGSVVVQLASGKRIAMRYLENPSAVIAQLRPPPGT